MIETETDPLARRLTAMEIATPAFRTPKEAPPSKPQVFAIAAGRRRRSRTTMLLALAVLMVGVAATYPVLGPDVLSLIGLTPGQVKPLTGTATYLNHRIEVDGGYADAVDTVLFASFDATADCQPNGPYLTDQFGQAYLLEGGWGVGVGLYPVVFDALRGEAARSGASLTLHCPVHVRGASTHDLSVAITGTLRAGSAKTLTPPPQREIAGTNYDVADVVWSGTYLEVHTRLWGAMTDALIAKIGSSENVSFPGVFLVTPSGTSEIPIANLDQRTFFETLQRDHVQDETRVFVARQKGTYRIVVAMDPGAAPLASWTIDVR